jgi:8-oxo-dGTP pyrophosphatase MutT (NUDIX family)
MTPKETIFQGKYFSLLADKVHGEMVQAEDEVLVVALTGQGEVLLTSEPSAAFDEAVLILPGGQVEPGETHELTANRELREETGYRANKLDFLGEVRPFSKYLSVRSFVYLARRLESDPLPGDEKYQIGMQRVSLQDFEGLIAAGQLSDARVIAGLSLARYFLTNHSEQEV